MCMTRQIEAEPRGDFSPVFYTCPYGGTPTCPNHCPGLQSWVALCASLAAGDDFDFDEGGEGEGLYGEGGTGRRVFGKEGGIDLVHGLEVIHGRQKAGGFYDVGVGVAGGLENGADVFHNLPGLLGDAARYELTGGGVKGHLPRNVEKTVGFDGLTVGADGCGSSCGTDDFTHGAFVLNYNQPGLSRG